MTAERMREIAAYLESLAQNDYMGAAGGFYTQGERLNEMARDLEEAAREEVDRRQRGS